MRWSDRQEGNGRNDGEGTVARKRKWVQAVLQEVSDNDTEPVV